MSAPRLPAKLFTTVYSLARRSGVLETQPGQRLFSRAYFFYKRHLEDPFYLLAKRHPDLFLGGHVLDIGANIGYTASVFARAVEPAFRVYSFEPEEFNFGMLERAARSIQPAGRIIPVRAAAGDRDEEAELWRNEFHHADHRIVTPRLREAVVLPPLARVPMMKIDTFVGAQRENFPVSFIKVDVQGFELPVCAGMERTLQVNPGVVVALEYTPSGMQDLGFNPADLLDWLAARRYFVYRLDRNGSFHEIRLRQFHVRSYADLLISARNLAAAPSAGISAAPQDEAKAR